MAEGKKSFVAYCDWIEIFEELDDNEAGKLIKHLLRYVNDQDPEPENQIIKLCFIPLKQSLKRDLKKYESYLEKQKANGKKGGRPKAKITQITQPFISKPKKADSVSVSDSVNDINYYKRFVDEVKKGFFDSRIEATYMRLRLKKGTLTPLIKDFNSNVIERNTKHKSLEDYFLNFINWLNVQDGINKLNEYKHTKSKGAL